MNKVNCIMKRATKGTSSTMGSYCVNGMNTVAPAQTGQKKHYHLPPSTSVCVDVGACNPVHSCMQRIYLGQCCQRRITLAAVFRKSIFVSKHFAQHARIASRHSHTHIKTFSIPFVSLCHQPYFELDKRDKFRFDNGMTECSNRNQW